MARDLWQGQKGNSYLSSQQGTEESRLRRGICSAHHIVIIGAILIALYAFGCRPSEKTSLITLALTPNAVVRCSDSSPRAGSVVVIRWEIFSPELCKITSIEFQPADDQQWTTVYQGREFSDTLLKNWFSGWKHVDHIEQKMHLPDKFNLSRSVFRINWQQAEPTSDRRHFTISSHSIKILMTSPPSQNIRLAVYIVDDANKEGLSQGMAVPTAFLERNELPVFALEDVVSAKIVLDEWDQPALLLSLSAFGSQKLEKAMESNLGRQLVIIIDDKIVSIPRIAGVNTTGKFLIRGLGFLVVEDIIRRIKSTRSSH